MKCDVEIFEEDLLQLIKDEFPAKLAEIDSEKSDGIILDIPKDAEYFNSTDDIVDNRKMAVQYGVWDGKANAIGAITAEENRYVFLVYLNDQNTVPGATRKRLLRYIRALKEILHENFRKFHYASSMDVQSIAPTETSWGENENSPVYKVGGIYIQASIVG